MASSDIGKVLVKEINSLYAKVNKTNDLSKCLMDYGLLKIAFNNEVEQEFFLRLDGDTLDNWIFIVKKMEAYIGKGSVLLRK